MFVNSISISINQSINQSIYQSINQSIIKIYVSNGLYSFVDDGVMTPIDDYYLGYKWLEVMTVFDSYDPLKEAEERKITVDKVFGL